MDSASQTTASIRTLINTLDFAAKKHSFQRRKDPQRTPYINHPIGVAKNLTDAGIDDLATLQAAILHDTVEDTDTTFSELEEHFGTEVRSIVDECTDDFTLSKDDRKRLQVESMPHRSTKAKMVKLADKLNNLRDLQRCVPVEWDRERVQEYFVWAKQVTDGAKGINQILEEQLEEMYKSGTFKFEGETFKSHPSYP